MTFDRKELGNIKTEVNVVTYLVVDVFIAKLSLYNFHLRLVVGAIVTNHDGRLLRNAGHGVVEVRAQFYAAFSVLMVLSEK